MTSSKPSSLKTRAELVAWFDQLLPKQQAYLNQSGASYLKEIRNFESLLRPLWGLVPKHSDHLQDLAKEPLFQELKAMVSQRALPEITTENRQIAVELGVVGFALGNFGREFVEILAADEINYFEEWLAGINQIAFPPGNWYFFLVLVNTGAKKAGLRYSEARLAFALAGIESFYLGDGWYSDGNNQQRDYYVSFAFHFYGLLYGVFGEPEVAEKFRQRALEFAQDFAFWFDQEGRSLPYGRSLTYRFAHISFWSALVITGVYQESGFSLGQIKGLILRHLRFWQAQPIQAIGNQQLTIGYGYENLILSEDYNAQGSPMWAFKAFVLLMLPAEDKFWQVAEEPLSLAPQAVQKHAGFHIQVLPEQNIALSSRQFANNQLLYHHHEKYSKFAYSTLYGFNLTRDNQHIENFAIDSTLAFSQPGFNQWQSRGVIDHSQIEANYGVSSWQVWQQIQVTSYLVPVENGGHLRIHEIETPFTVECFEGGFPLPDWNQKYQKPSLSETTAMIENQHGLSLIRGLGQGQIPKVIPQGPNSNIYSDEKNAVPALYTKLAPGKHYLASLVYAGKQPTHQQLEVAVTYSAQEIEITGDFQLHIPKFSRSAE